MKLVRATWPVAVLLVVGCGKKSGTDGVVQDSTGRDLSLAPVDSSAAINDKPQQAESSATTPSPAPAPEPAPPPPSTKPKPKPSSPPAAPAPSPAPSPAPAPAPPPAPPARSVAVGSLVTLKTTEEFGTKTHKVGQTVTATVASDVKDENGNTVIPAGSTMTFTITELAVSENKDDPGKLALKATKVTINGESHDVNGVTTDVEHTLKGRGVKAGDAAKVGAGAAAGAIVGKIIGKKKGAVVGGVVGAAAGTAVAINSADRDVVVAAGAKILLKLSSAFSLS